jgi:hypothetical protein
VHQRSEGEKAQDLPLLQQVAQMQAAGDQGNGSALQNSSTPALWRSNRTRTTARIDDMINTGTDDIEISAFLRKNHDSTALSSDKNITSKLLSVVSRTFLPNLWRKKPVHQSLHSQIPLYAVLKSLDNPANSLVVIIRKFNAQAYEKRTFHSALSATLRNEDVNFIIDLILKHAKTLGSPAMVWAVLLLWLTDEKGLPLNRHARRLLQSEIKDLNKEEINQFTLILDNFNSEI